MAKAKHAITLNRLTGLVKARVTPITKGIGAMNRRETAVQLRQLVNSVKTRKEQAFRDLEEAVDGFHRDLANERYRHLWQFREMEQELEDVPEVVELAVPTYVVGSLFLDHCKSVLTMDEKEYMVYVTGTEDDGRIYLTTLLHFETERSVGGVHGDPESVLQAVLRLQRAGHRLYGWFHSHPGSRDACSPSSIDTGMQRRLEDLKYPAIGAVFTRDGHVRFFSVARQFQVQIHGEGVEHVDAETSLYKISLPG